MAFPAAKWWLWFYTQGRVKKGRGCVLQDSESSITQGKVAAAGPGAPGAAWLHPPRALPKDFAGQSLLQELPSWETEKKQQRFPPPCLPSKVEEQSVSAEAIIQAGTWRAFSSLTLPQPQPLALCCSFIHRLTENRICLVFNVPLRAAS